MNLSELLDAAGPAPLRAHVLLGGGSAQVSDVVIYDQACPLSRGQVVLAVGVDATSPQARELVAEAGRQGVAAVVFRAAGRNAGDNLAGTSETSILLADRQVGWAQLLLLLRTLTSATQDETARTDERSLPGSLHGLADAIAAMVGGSVVLYDRAHRVIAYSVQGYEIDDVRRDAILGKRTPEQWIRRFTIDRSAYQTYQDPDEVVRVDKYPGLQARLRIAIHAGGEILGEVSVAEGGRPLGPEAEVALKRAARLAVPFMLRHRLAEDADRTARWQMLHGLLEGDPAAESYSPRLALDLDSGLTVVGFAVHSGTPSDAMVDEVFNERLVHLLSLQMSSIDAAAKVLFDAGKYYALVPTSTDPAHHLLAEQLKPALDHLGRLRIDVRAAVGCLAVALQQLPMSRRSVDDQLMILARKNLTGVVGTIRDLWADLALLPAERAVMADDPILQEHLGSLARHDERNGSEFVKTLRVYLEEFGSISAAAERLVLHPNTLRHRLQRLAEVSGIDLADPTQRLALALQLRATQRDSAGRQRVGATESRKDLGSGGTA